MRIASEQEYAEIVACFQALRAKDAAALCALLQRLPAMSPRTVKVLILRFGLEDGHPQTVRAIARVLGMGPPCTLERVERLLRHGYLQLRHPLRWVQLQAALETPRRA